MLVLIKNREDFKYNFGIRGHTIIILYPWNPPSKSTLVLPSPGYHPNTGISFSFSVVSEERKTIHSYVGPSLGSGSWF